jgi:hypothetical protein
LLQHLEPELLLLLLLRCLSLLLLLRNVILD